MNPDALKNALAARPFRPFNLYDPSGAIYAVRSPDQAVLTADLRTLVVPKTDRPTSGGVDLLDVIMAERFEILSEEPMPPQWWMRGDADPPRGGLGSDAA